MNQEEIVKFGTHLLQTEQKYFFFLWTWCSYAWY